MSAPRIPRVPVYADELRHENDALRAQLRDLEAIVRRLLVVEGEHEAALRIADRSCVADIETQARPVADAAGARWYDTRFMLDDAPEMAQMGREAIDYALARGMAVRDAQRRHLVRIVRQP